ncbi:MAG: tail fiber domain-containing protein [Bacteroidales bacterium]|nr:tail fiber domain-containing protein [Bacteroidales bacterium]
MKTHAPFKCLCGIFLLSVFLFSGSFVIVSAQPASGFNFQAVARDEAGGLIKNTGLAVTVGIRVGSGTGDLVWEETHNVTTNDFGLISLVVCGDPGLKTGGSAETPAGISWSSAEHFIVLAIHTGNREIVLEPQPLRPVPYSLSITGPSPTVPALSVQSNNPRPEGEALFQVKRYDGSVAFAVYEDMVWVYVDTVENKGVKGGFAVGGYRKDTKGEGPDYMRITPDSIRFYFEEDALPGKGVKGGFAVGGYRTDTKGEAVDYMQLTSESIQFNIDQDTVSGKGVKGGFAVGGYTQGKGITRDFLRLTPENFFIGDSAGANNTTGIYNIFLGYKTGAKNTEGYQNTFLGYEAGYSNVGTNAPGTFALGTRNCYIGFMAGKQGRDGAFNTLIGSEAGLNNNGSFNTFIGSAAGVNNTEGGYNAFIGTCAGANNLTGAQNIFLGHNAGLSNVNGAENIAIGTVAGACFKSGVKNIVIGPGAGSGKVYEEDGTGNRNVIIGDEAGKYTRHGSNNVIIGAGAASQSIEGAGTGTSNVIIGFEAGAEAVNSSNNIFIGNRAGVKEKESNKLYISNSETLQPLIWGDFEMKQMVINGNGQDNVIDQTFYVNGSAGGVEPWINESDARFKKDIVPIENALDKVEALEGVYFTWKDESDHKKGRQMGFIAQQAEAVIPEAVSYNGNYYGMQYAPITALLVQAIKEQQELIDLKESEIRSLEERIARLEKLVLQQ